MSAAALPVAEARPCFDGPALAAYLHENIRDFCGPVRVSPCHGGLSNPTYLLQTREHRYAMRLKPAPKAALPASAHAVEREYRVQAALQGSAVPVARMHCLCEDESVIGRAFYVMDYIEGRIYWDQSLPGMAKSMRAAIYDELNRVIGELHRVDVATLQLLDYGRSGNYVHRQIERWSQRYLSRRGDTIAAMDRLAEWLPQHVPRDDPAQITLVHGDYRLDNVIFHPTEPRILAVIDWELSTLGHPMADFAYHVMSWHLLPQHLRGLGGMDLPALGIPDEASYIASYERRCARRFSGDWNFYLAYNLFRLAAILHHVAGCVESGVEVTDQAVAYARQVGPLAELGWRFAQRVAA